MAPANAPANIVGMGGEIGYIPHIPDAEIECINMRGLAPEKERVLFPSSGVINSEMEG